MRALILTGKAGGSALRVGPGARIFAKASDRRHWQRPVTAVADGDQTPVLGQKDASVQPSQRGRRARQTRRPCRINR